MAKKKTQTVFVIDKNKPVRDNLDMKSPREKQAVSFETLRDRVLRWRNEGADDLAICHRLNMNQCNPAMAKREVDRIIAECQ